jgi:hypothetical protein
MGLGLVYNTTLISLSFAFSQPLLHLVHTQYQELLPWGEKGTQIRLESRRDVFCSIVGSSAMAPSGSIGAEKERSPIGKCGGAEEEAAGAPGQAWLSTSAWLWSTETLYRNQ